MTTKEVIEYLRQRETELQSNVGKIQEARKGLRESIIELGVAADMANIELDAVSHLLKVMLNEDTQCLTML